MSSENRDAELARAQAEVQRLRGTLAAYASAANHDLHAPLRHIRMFAELIARDHGQSLPEGAAAYLDRILSSVDRSERLVAALVEYARLASAPPRLERVDLTAIAEAATAPFAETMTVLGAQLQIGELPEALGDRAHLERVFAALADNALKYRGGRAPSLEIASIEAPAGYVSVQVSDAGPGLPAEHGEAAFELLRRLTGADAVEGEGMGLALCKLLMEMQGGRIRHNPDHAPGAAFVITLPAPA